MIASDFLSNYGKDESMDIMERAIDYLSSYAVGMFSGDPDCYPPYIEGDTKKERRDCLLKMAMASAIMSNGIEAAGIGPDTVGPREIDGRQVDALIARAGHEFEIYRWEVC